MIEPHITKHALLDYLNDRLDDPVTQAYLDQHAAAADDVRAAFGINFDHAYELPTERGWAALKRMWLRVFDLSANDVCDHVLDRPVQPTVITVDYKQLCLDCARAWTVPASIRKGAKHACSGCGAVETLRPDLDPSGSIWADVHQRGEFIAYVILCYSCHLAVNSREELSPAIRAGIMKLRGAR